jgi:alpha-tubulin suppressor-like RCC1 family protein
MQLVFNQANTMNIKRRFVQTCFLCALQLQVLTIGAQTVTKVAAGFDHSVFLKSDGSLWTMGYDYYGALGDGNYFTSSPYGTNQPEEIVTNGVTAIAAGDETIFLKSDGSLWGMGYDGYGELGASVSMKTNRPVQIATNVIAIDAGWGDETLFLKSDGSLWAMGNDQNGELGDGRYITSSPYGTNQPEEIVTNGVTAISAGFDHSLFLKSDGSLWGMGSDGYGQLGDGNPGNLTETNRPVEILTNGVTAIAAGEFFSLFLKSDGSLWGMGYNFSGQLGDGNNSNTNRPVEIVTNGVTAIATGYEHSLFLKSDGSLWGMGFNEYGGLGDGIFNTNTPFGTNQPQQIVPGGVTVMSAGGFHSLFVKNDGSLWGMGSDQYGQLGDGNYTTNAPYGINQPKQIVAGVPPGYNQISAQLLSSGNVGLSYVGMAGTNYALDRSFSLKPVNWAPQMTNPAGAGGILKFTNAPNPATNNFWRIRSVP